jgi:hypothetical protein
MPNTGQMAVEEGEERFTPAEQFYALTAYPPINKPRAVHAEKLRYNAMELCIVAQLLCDLTRDNTRRRGATSVPMRGAGRRNRDCWGWVPRK